MNWFLSGLNIARRKNTIMPIERALTNIAGTRVLRAGWSPGIECWRWVMRILELTCQPSLSEITTCAGERLVTEQRHGGPE